MNENLIAWMRNKLKKHDSQLAENQTQINNLETNKADKTYVDTNYSTLDTKINSQASGSPKATFSTLALLQADANANTTDGKKNIYVVTADGNWYYWNSSAWQAGGVYQSTGIANGSVGQEKLSFVPMVGIKGKNLFDKLTVTPGYYVSQDTGALVANASYYASDWIPVDASTQYTRILTSQMAFYNSNKTYISGGGLATFTTPSNCAYVRLSINNSNVLLTEQLELGAASTAYVEGGNKVRSTDILSETINVNHLSKSLKNELTTKIPFGFDPAYEQTMPWTNPATGTSTITWKSNNGTFSEGKYYVEVFHGNADVQGSIVWQYLPEEYRKDITRTARVVFAYSSNCSFNLKMYQQKKKNTWCSPNTVVNTTFPTTNLRETYAEILVPILSDSTILVPYIENLSLNGTVNIGTLKCSILGSGITTKTVTVASNGGDYTTITSALASITDATPYRKYTINVKNGTYNECNIITKNYVDIIGESRDGVIIRADGTINTGKSAADESGIFAITNTTIKNLTIDANEVKYCVHNDSASSPYEFIARNCRFIHRGCAVDQLYHPIGIGAGEGQNNRFFNCEFESQTTMDAPVSGIYWHNWNNNTVPSELEVVDCKAINCNIAYLTELGSTQADICTFTNCTTNLLDGGIIVDSNNSSYIPTSSLVDIPYCFQLFVYGSIPRIKKTANRPNTAKYHVVNSYETLAINKEITTIPIGYGIIHDYADFTQKQCAVKIATGGVIDGVVLQDITTNTIGYVIPRKKACGVYTTAASYSRGDMLKCNSDGTFSKTVVFAERVAIAMQTVTLASNGLLDALIL